MLLPSECRAEVNKRSDLSSFATWNQSSYPKGCVKYSTGAYYNHHATGAGHGSMQQICHKGKFSPKKISKFWHLF